MHGVMPKSASSSSSRVQRARSAASKPNAKPERKKLKREEIKKEVKLEPVEIPEGGDEEPSRINGEFVSPRRAVKNLSRESHSAELQVVSLDGFVKESSHPNFAGHLEGS